MFYSWNVSVEKWLISIITVLIICVTQQLQTRVHILPLCSFQTTIWSRVVILHCDWFSCFRAVTDWQSIYLPPLPLIYIHLHPDLLHVVLLHIYERKFVEQPVLRWMQLSQRQFFTRTNKPKTLWLQTHYQRFGRKHPLRMLLVDWMGVISVISLRDTR